MNKMICAKTENHEDALKFAYAFMKSGLLNIKECSFPNPNPSKPKKGYIFSEDTFYPAFTDKNLPSWENFKIIPENQIQAYSCIACVDKNDENRVACGLMNSEILFTWFGDYDKEAKAAFDDILRIRKYMNQ